MGLHVVVSDMDPRAPGFAFADGRVIASTYDGAATASAALRYHRETHPIAGVICMAADVPMTVAMVAEALQLPGLSLATAKLASDKLAMKRRFVEAGIPVPWFCALESPAHLKDLIRSMDKTLVIKPVDSRGARGVLRMGPGVDPDWAFRHACGYSPSGRVMVEEYISGPQISTESVLLEDRAFTPGFSDRNYEFLDRFAPHLIENGGQQPSSLSESDRIRVVRLAETAGRSMGISNGIAKGDMVLSERGPLVIEVAARLSGGWFSTDQIPLATGVDLIGAAIKLAIGEEVTETEAAPRYWKGVAIRYFFPEPGEVVAIGRTDSFNALPWVHRIGFFVKPGDILEPVINHTKRAGYVITTGTTRQEAVQRAESVVAAVRIETRALDRRSPEPRK